VHTLPAVQDVLANFPGAKVDWVVEKGFASLVQRCDGISRVIPCELRKWSKSPLAATTREQWRAFRDNLRQTEYDAILDLQGLTKSAIVARTARTTSTGKRYALANRTEGSGYEAPTRWVADVAVRIEPRIDAVTRSRRLCAAALGYEVPPHLKFGLKATPHQATDRPCIAFIHGTSRDDKCWPQTNWVELGKRFTQQGFSIGLPHGNDAELQRSHAIAHEIGEHAHVWPRLDLATLTDWMASCAGVIGVDSGLSHIAVALDLPHVQVYNFDTAWRTGPAGGRQRSVYGSPSPSLDAVWQAWQAAAEAR
jgi:heptosyltransferase-1